MSTDTLWAVHIAGPDDVIAAKDRAEADAKAAEINDLWERFTQRADYDPELDPRWHATVIPWPGSAEDHAGQVALGDERWTP